MLSMWDYPTYYLIFTTLTSISRISRLGDSHSMTYLKGFVGLRAVLLLLLSFSSFTSALNLGHKTNHDGIQTGRDPSFSLVSDNIFKRVDPNEEFEHCERACAPRVNTDGSPDQAAFKRMIATHHGFTTPKLDIRDMTLPDGDMEKFMLSEVPKAQQIVWQIPKGTDINTAVSRSFGDSRRGFSLGTMGLCGCTSVWIISRSGVYASHFWESISFSPDDIWRRVKSETNTQVFQRTVIQPMKDGETNDKGRKMQDKVDVGILGNDDSVRAYIVHPERSCYANNQNAYRPKWDLIKTTVGEIIPALDPATHDDRWNEPIYQRKDRDDDALFTSSAGRVLFKYDPNHQGKKKATLWVEGREEPWHDDEW
ncbi:hypothetical protein AK830_g5791 [Neonectria ditissima]|uniref:Uncharacterized protein n=1 Tax=Neonectria ditissima TaxID=78410 RepID=A0A0P7BDS2_9HYPO|nr:hypothetical protein AK830_g5791 [Neonectria ditissima]